MTPQPPAPVGATKADSQIGNPGFHRRLQDARDYASGLTGALYDAMEELRCCVEIEPSRTRIIELLDRAERKHTKLTTLLASLRAEAVQSPLTNAQAED